MKEHILLGVKAMFSYRYRLKGVAKDLKTSCKKTYINAHYINKGIDAIKLQSMFSDRSLLRLINFNTTEKEKILISFSYDACIGRKFSNYSKTLRNLKNQELSNYLETPCMCQNSKFIDKASGHIITGDLNMIESKELRDCMGKGANFRLPKIIDWDEVLAEGKRVIEKIIAKVKNRAKNSLTEIQNFRTAACVILSNRVSYFRKMNHFSRTSTFFNEATLTSELKKLSKRFIITTADKAGNNFVLICKKHYIAILCSELGISIPNGVHIPVAKGNDVYELVLDSEEKIVEKHKVFSKSFGIKVGEEDMCLPVFFSIPKMHKDPYKFRFIAGARHSSIKTLSVLFCQILKHFREHLRRYCDVITGNTGINCFWSINNSQEAIKMLEQVSDIDCLVSGDFSTLYTKLMHSDVKKELQLIFSKLFTNSGKRYIVVTYNRVYYSKEPGKTGVSLELDQIVVLSNYILDNTFVRFGEFIFRQIQGIPMGGNSSPQMADLALAGAEIKFITNKKNEIRKKKMLHVVRYVDDVFGVNCPELIDICKTIYPASLPLNDTSVSDKVCDYLDLHIDCTKELTSVSIYNKTDVFPFKVNRYVDGDSNISDKLSAQVFYSALHRIASICSNKTALIEHIRTLCIDFREKGLTRNNMHKKFLEFCSSYRPLCSKFGCIDKKKSTIFFETCFPP